MTAMGRLIRCWTAAALLLPPALSAQPVPEYELKAAFVYNFVLFTDWPADTSYEGGNLNICVNPNSAMRGALARLGGKPAKGRRIAVRHPTMPDGVRDCQVLFVGAGDNERWLQIRERLGGASVLTIADGDEASPEDGIITLTTQGNRIVFDVDTRAARQARLALSSKLLRLARTVQ